MWSGISLWCWFAFPRWLMTLSLFSFPGYHWTRGGAFLDHLVWGCASWEDTWRECGSSPRDGGSLPGVWDWLPASCFTSLCGPGIGAHLPLLNRHMGPWLRARASEKGEWPAVPTLKLTSRCFRPGSAPQWMWPWAKWVNVSVPSFLACNWVY